MTDQDVRSADAGSAQELAEIIDDRAARPECCSRIAIARPEAGTVVRADSRGFSDSRLHGLPRRQRIPQSGLQNHGWTSATAAGEMEASSADVDERVANKSRRTLRVGGLRRCNQPTDGHRDDDCGGHLNN